MKISKNSLYYLSAIIIGIYLGNLNNDLIYLGADYVARTFIKLLQLVSIPIIFCSVVATLTKMSNLNEFKYLSITVLKYTLLTTLIAASVALLLFLNIKPHHVLLNTTIVNNAETLVQSSYFEHFFNLVPSNIIEPFREGNVIGVLFLALLFGLATVGLPSKNRIVLHDLFSSLYSAVLKMTGFFVKPMPFAICAFVILFVKEMQKGLDSKEIALYLLCIVAANIIQAFIVLPIVLLCKRIPVFALFKNMLPAISFAFWSKSSAAALPLALQCAEEKAGIQKQVAHFSFPLCTTINMNACAAFILITVLFVSSLHGAQYTMIEYIGWIFVATIAAIGNAGVPMGCYFLASALLATNHVPIYILGIILPFYTLIDMLESAINIWSDAVVTAVVNKNVIQKNHST